MKNLNYNIYMLFPTVKHGDLSLLNVKSPTPAEIKLLSKNFGFSMLHLEDFLYKTQIPKTEPGEAYDLVVMDIPCIKAQQKQSLGLGDALKLPFSVISSTGNIFLRPIPKSPKEKRLSIGEVDFFIGKDYVVILHDEEVQQIDDIFLLCKTNKKYREEYMGQGPLFLFYRIADILVDSAITFANDITTTIDQIDRKLEKSRPTNIIEDISITRRNIVIFETMVKPALAMFSDLEKGKYENMTSSKMKAFWSNIVDHLERVAHRLDDNKQLIQGISTNYESLLTVRTNETIRVLTIFTAILLPLTLLASIYGMNVALPFQHNPHVFNRLIITMIITSVLMLGFFKFRDWI